MSDQQAYIQSLGTLIKPASADCNLRCEYCFYLPKLALYPQSKRHVMPREVMHKFVGDYMQMSGLNPSFGWQGGEPTTLGVNFFRRVVAVQAQKAKAGQAIANGFQTNGVLIDDEWARFFRRYNFLVGVSLDGPAHIHDHYRCDHRGKPSFDRVMRGIEALERNSAEFNVLCMVTSHSGDNAEEIYDFFIENDLRFLQFIPCIERHPETGEIQPYSCTPQQYGRFLCHVFDKWSAEEPAKTYVRIMDDLLMTFAGHQAPSCIFRQHCADYLLVEHNGDIYPCDFFVEPEWLLGNVMETPLREIALSEKFREFRHNKSRHGQGCSDCQWLNLCFGGCPRHRLTTGPDVHEATYFCEAYRMLFEHAGQKLTDMASKLEQLRPEQSGRLPVDHR